MNKTVRICRFFVLFFVVYTASAVCQEGELSILQQGPEQRKGLPFFLPNAIPHFKGVYNFRGSKVQVFYTESAMLRRPEWAPVECGDSRVFTVRDQSHDIYIYPMEGDRRTFFFLFDPERQDVCGFIDPFLSRFRYFLGITRDRMVPPFPAVVPLE